MRILRTAKIILHKLLPALTHIVNAPSGQYKSYGNKYKDRRPCLKKL